MVIPLSFGFYWGAVEGNYLIIKRHLRKHLGFLNPDVSLYRAYEIYSREMQLSQTAQTVSQVILVIRAGQASFQNSL